jgi:hypothetical protein
MNVRRYIEILASIGIGVIILGMVGTSVNAAAGDTTLVSVNSDGQQGNDNSLYPFISSDGRYVAIESSASNLVNGDTNGMIDVFVHDVVTGLTTRESVSSSGIQGNGVSDFASISSDGRFVAFESNANNLVSDDVNATEQIYLHDRQSGETSLISVSPDGHPGNSTSAYPAISSDGKFIVFISRATNLINGDTNGVNDTFVRDIQNNITIRISVAPDGTQGNNNSFGSVSISSDGRYVAFCSSATNLVNGDSNSHTDIFIHDMQTGETKITSVATDGTQGNADVTQFDFAISASGRFVTFSSVASNLVSGDTNGKSDVFVRDTQTNTTTRVSVSSSGEEGNNISISSDISNNGRYVAFYSLASNLVSGDTNGIEDVFVRDTKNESTVQISVDSNGVEGNHESYSPSISDDGRYVAFESSASNLVIGDTNNKADIFVHENDVPSVLPWTIMVYLDGDNSLDPNYVNVFNQLETTANNTNINIVVAWDRKGANNSAYYKVNYDTNLSQLATYTEGVDRWNKGEINMGYPSTLSDFVTWARTNYPAQHYVLLISNHGTGLNGTAIDENSGNDWLTVNELGNALSTATSNGSDKLDIVFADSCLMGMIEDGYQIRNYANIYIASENLIWIPASGTRPYSNYFTGITSYTTPQQLATGFVTEYGSWLDNAWPGKYGYTLSAVDLIKIDMLATSISDLGATLQSQIATYANQIQTARNVAQKFDSNGNQVISNSDEYVDLSDLALQLKSIPDIGIQSAAQNVIDAVGSYVISSAAKPGNIYPGLDGNRDHGVSIFFPSGDFTRSFYNGLNLDFANGTDWGTQSGLMLTQQSPIDWGPLLVDYVENVSPAATDDPNPPDLTSPIETIINISGNAGVAGVTLKYTDVTAKTSTTDGNGNYSLQVSYNWSGEVTPEKTGYTFTPGNHAYSNIQSDQIDQNFTAILNILITGNVGTSGVTLNYKVGGITKSVISDSKGNYTISIPYGWTGTVTPTKICGGRNSLMRCSFAPSQKSYTNVTVDQKGQNFILKRVY